MEEHHSVAPTTCRRSWPVSCFKRLWSAFPRASRLLGAGLRLGAVAQCAHGQALGTPSERGSSREEAALGCVCEQVWFSTQPMEEPATSGELINLFDRIRGTGCCFPPTTRIGISTIRATRFTPIYAGPARAVLDEMAQVLQAGLMARHVVATVDQIRRASACWSRSMDAKSGTSMSRASISPSAIVARMRGRPRARDHRRARRGDGAG